MKNFELDQTPVYDPDIIDLSKTNAVRAVCFTLDGQNTEMVTTLPGITSWMEPLEVAARKLEETLKYLTMHFTAFRAYQIQIGIINQEPKTRSRRRRRRNN